MGMTETKYCAKHPRVETNLRCGKCGDLICPDCLVHTPVGVRCADCAQVKRVPTYDVTGQFITRGVIAGLLLGIASGTLFFLIFGVLPQFVPGIFRIFNVLWPLMFAGVGLVIGAGISLAVNRKRGKSLKIVAA